MPLTVGRRLSRLPFTMALLIRILVYGALIMAALLLVPWIVLGVKPQLHDPSLPLAIEFSVGASLIINFCVATPRLLLIPSRLVKAKPHR